MPSILEEKSQPELAKPKERLTVEEPLNNNEVATAPANETPKSPASSDKQTDKSKKQPFYKNSTTLVIIGVVLVILSLVGLHYYSYYASHESTDDAFVEGHIIQISPKIVGHVTKVYVVDNQQVKEGELIAEIDNRDYQAQLDQAKAALQSAISKQQAASSNVTLTQVNSSANVEQATSVVQGGKAGVEAARAQQAAQREQIQQMQAQIGIAQANIEQARAEVTAREADATRARSDVERYEILFKSGDVSHQQYDTAVATAKMADAQLEAARKKVVAANSQLEVARTNVSMSQESLRQAQSQVERAQANVGEAQGRLAAANSAPQQVAVSKAQAETATAEVASARAAVEKAELALSYTKVYAPEAGRITRKSIEEGAFVQIGQVLMAIVPDQFWVTANFKETQLANMQPGQEAEIRIDAYPGKVFKGHVDSIQRGAGSRFSLLPPENASGNYVKVVQRVPVKIVFDENPGSQFPLGPGMSAEPEVRIK